MSPVLRAAAGFATIEDASLRTRQNPGSVQLASRLRA
jgi:hypothetical protein